VNDHSVSAHVGSFVDRASQDDTVRECCRHWLKEIERVEGDSSPDAQKVVDAALDELLRLPIGPGDTELFDSLNAIQRHCYLSNQPAKLRAVSAETVARARSASNPQLLHKALRTAVAASCEDGDVPGAVATSLEALALPVSGDEQARVWNNLVITFAVRDVRVMDLALALVVCSGVSGR